MGSQHPSPNVNTLSNFEPNFWPEIFTSRDAESTRFKGSRTSCEVIALGFSGPNVGRKSSHHVMDASCQYSSCSIAVSRYTAPLSAHLGTRKEGGVDNSGLDLCCSKPRVFLKQRSGMALLSLPSWEGIPAAAPVFGSLSTQSSRASQIQSGVMKVRISPPLLQILFNNSNLL